MKIFKCSATLLFAALLFTTSCKQNEKAETKMDKTVVVEEPVVEETKMEETKMVGGAEMFPSKNIVENAMNSKDHTTLVSAVKAADLVETLSGAGPFTVFAPTNAAFDMLPKAAVADLMKPENKSKLKEVLTYHVASGKWSAMDVLNKIKEGNGKFEIPTVEGGILTAWEKNGNVYLTDENGTKAMITIADVNQSNGVIHVIDHVLMPK